MDTLAVTRPHRKPEPCGTPAQETGGLAPREDSPACCLRPDPGVRQHAGWL